MRTLGLLGILCLLTTNAFAEDAPFGLRWGETIDEVKTHGLPGDVQQDDGHLQIFQTNKLSDAPGNSDFARLGIDRKFGLQRILWVSQAITDDPTGAKGLELYRTLKRDLTDRYDKPKSSDEEFVGSRTHGPNSFYQCLAEDGCAVFVTVWRAIRTDVRLRLLGSSSGKGRLEVVYLGPDWNDVMTENKKKTTP